jgi:hypothetical protein
MVVREMGRDASLIRKNSPILWHRALVSLSFSQDLRDRYPWLLLNDCADSAPESSHCLEVRPHVRMLLQMPLYSIVYRVWVRAPWVMAPLHMPFPMYLYSIRSLKIDLQPSWKHHLNEKLYQILTVFFPHPMVTAEVSH